MLDDKGNVIAMTVSGYIDNSDMGIGINFFIPIAEALDVLNIKRAGIDTGTAAPLTESAP